MQQTERHRPSIACVKASDGPAVALWSDRSQSSSGSRCLPRIICKSITMGGNAWVTNQKPCLGHAKLVIRGDHIQSPPSSSSYPSVLEVRKGSLEAFVGLRDRVHILTVPYDTCKVPRVQRRKRVPGYTVNCGRQNCAEIKNGSGSIRPNRALIPR